MPISYRDLLGEGSLAPLTPRRRRPSLESYLLGGDVSAETPEPEPEPEESPGLLSRIGSGLGTIGHAVSTPFRGLGMLADVARSGGLEGSQTRITGQDGDTGSALSDVFDPTVQAPNPAQIALEGYRVGAQTMGGVSDVGELTGLRREEATTRKGFERAHPFLSRSEAFLEPVAELGLQFATDPALAALGPLGQAGRFGRAAQRGIGLSFVPGMTEGAIESGKQAYSAAQDEGITSPAALRAGAGVLTNAALAGLGLKHGLSRGKPIPSLEAEPVAPPTPAEAYRSSAGYPSEAPYIPDVVDYGRSTPPLETGVPRAGAEAGPAREAPPPPALAPPGPPGTEAIQAGLQAGKQAQAPPPPPTDFAPLARNVSRPRNQDLIEQQARLLEGQDIGENPLFAPGVRKALKARAVEPPMAPQEPIVTPETLPPALAPEAPQEAPIAPDTPFNTHKARLREEAARENPTYLPKAIDDLAQARAEKGLHRLSGLPEREIFAEAVEAKRYQAFASMDAKDFGLLNKIHGHPAGDRAIKAIAEGLELVRANHPDVDLFHTGGDEFRVGGKSPEAVQAYEAAAREYLAKHTFEYTLDGKTHTLPLPEVDFGHGLDYEAADTHLGTIKRTRAAEREAAKSRRVGDESPEGGQVEPEAPGRQAGPAGRVGEPGNVKPATIYQPDGTHYTTQQPAGAERAGKVNERGASLIDKQLEAVKASGEAGSPLFSDNANRELAEESVPKFNEFDPQERTGTDPKYSVKPTNPFTEKAKRARAEYERLVQPTAHERGMADSFPLGAGFGRPGGAKRVDASVGRSVQAEQARKNAEHYEGQARSFESGDVDAQGRRQNPATAGKREAEASGRQGRAERIAAAKETLGTKEPWEVTRQVAADASGQMGGAGRGLVEHNHRVAVERAVADGRAVPAEVLADYPSLGTKYSTKPNAQGFYSQLERAAEKIPQAMSGNDVLRYLADPKRGVKAEELKWTGLDDFLKQKHNAKVTPKEVQDFIRQNTVEVKEVTKSVENTAARANVKALRAAMTVAREAFVRDRTPSNEAVWREADRRHGEAEMADSDKPKFSQYQLPGGENYRELLLTLPRKGVPKELAARVLEAGKRQRDLMARLDEAKDTPEEASVRRDLSRANEEYVALQEEGAKSERNVRSGHWDEPNVLAHVRFNDRVDSQGKRVLFVEEVQSDFGQAHRKMADQVKEMVSSDWAGFVKKLKDNGALKVICD